MQLPLVGQPQSCALLNRATTALTLCVHSKAAQKPTNVFFFAKRSELTVVSPPCAEETCNRWASTKVGRENNLSVHSARGLFTDGLSAGHPHAPVEARPT